MPLLTAIENEEDKLNAYQSIRISAEGIPCCRVPGLTVLLSYGMCKWLTTRLTDLVIADNSFFVDHGNDNNWKDRQVISLLASFVFI